MKTQGGFTLIEASVTAVILMVGVIALIQVGKATTNQVTDIRQKYGQTAIAERLIHDQVEAILASDTAPDPPPEVPPLGLDGIVYRSVPTKQPDAKKRDNLVCYSIQVKFKGADGIERNFKAGDPITGPDSPVVYIWRVP